MIVRDWCRDGDDERVSRLRRDYRPKPSGFHCRAEHHVKIRLDNMGPARIDPSDCIPVNVDTDYVKAARGKCCGGWKSDVAKPHDGDGLNCGLHLMRSLTMRSLARPSPNGFAPLAMTA